MEKRTFLRSSLLLVTAAFSQPSKLWSANPNPSFDVTSADLISGIICEKGLIENPTLEKMKRVLG
jgi:methylthioribose-1-phosphate isomerase